jgi:hypothetical protein
MGQALDANVIIFPIYFTENQVLSGIFPTVFKILGKIPWKRLDWVRSQGEITKVFQRIFTL